MTTRKNQPSAGMRELDLASAEPSGMLELDNDDLRLPPEPISAADAGSTPIDLPEASGIHQLELDAHPELGRERAVRREAALQQEVQERRALYRPPVERPGAELSVAKIVYSVIGLAIVVGCAYWFCRYQVGDKQYAFYKKTRPLRDLVMKTGPVPGVEDVRRIVQGLAAESGVRLDQLQIIVEPLASSKNIDKLDGEDATKAWAYKAEWIVGFQAQVYARYGVVKRRVPFERFFYLHDFKR